MALNITLAELLDRIRQRGEIRSNYVSDATMYDWINSGIAELHRGIVNINPDFYMADPSTVAVSSGTSTYSLPADFYMGRGADVQLEDSTWINMRKFNWGERNNLPYSTTERRWTTYRFTDADFRLTPEPAWSGNCRIWYVYTPPVLDNSDPGTSDVWDTIAGFDEHVILNCLVKYAGLAEDDPTVYASSLGKVEKQIYRCVQHRDIGEPDRIRDIRRERGLSIYPTYDRP